MAPVLALGPSLWAAAAVVDTTGFFSLVVRSIVPSALKTSQYLVDVTVEMEEDRGRYLQG